jgi:hypothetical protein
MVVPFPERGHARQQRNHTNKNTNARQTTWKQDGRQGRELACALKPHEGSESIEQWQPPTRRKFDEGNRSHIVTTLPRNKATQIAC